MKHIAPRRALLALTIAGLLAACASPPGEQVSGAAAVPLVNTHWRLTQLGGQVLEGGNSPDLQIQAQNPRIAGFAGCNRMFGGYTLSGDQIRFDQMGATKMACVDAARMKLEQDYLQMLSQVARWKITASTLQLLDATGAPLASFAAASAAQ